MFKFENGLHVPDDDVNGVRWISDDLIHIPNMLSHVPARRVCVQAGGNVGIWPNAWGEHFQAVYTFEPNPKNFRCLTRNSPAMNIHPFPAALGDTHTFVGTTMWEAGNTGAYRIEGSGAFPVLRIDDFAWEHLDLIQLDIEGYEHAALLGGERSILRYHPVLILELKGHGARYGRPDSDTHALLANWGYRAVATYGCDTVFAAT